MSRSGASLAVRFGIAGLLGAVALAAPTRLSDRDRKMRPVEQDLGACLAAGCPDALKEQRVARFEDHLFARMPGLDPALHEDLARAILAETESARLDPLLVLAVIQVESGYDPAARSGAGAVGLMQLLPGTLQREAEGLGHAELNGLDPVANVRAGVRYLRRCLDSYPDPDVALMAYNAGPNRLYGWIQAGGVVPAEVSGYARRVLAEQRRLHRTLGEEPGPRFAQVGLPAGR